MVPERDDETGQFKKQYPVQSFLRAVVELDTPTTSKVAQYVGCSYDLAYRRLDSLATQGEICKQEVGNSLLWIPADNRSRDKVV